MHRRRCLFKFNHVFNQFLNLDSQSPSILRGLYIWSRFNKRKLPMRLILIFPIPYDIRTVRKSDHHFKFYVSSRCKTKVIFMRQWHITGFQKVQENRIHVLLKFTNISREIVRSRCLHDYTRIIIMYNQATKGKGRI